ncbi:MAG: hypothetical protein ACI9EM_000745 [Candidatus Thalassarchaeaceae archaeon]|jgi:hypothetical protein|tara:strand:+ start:488 stop:1603 length:1116 start_codon:yes stop_codon:yes gene_type:complete
MKKPLAALLCMTLLISFLAGCVGNGNDSDSQPDDVGDNSNSDPGGSTSEPEISPNAITCPDGTTGTLEWRVVTCAEPKIFKTSDVSNETFNLTIEWYSIGAAEWGNYGPVEIYIIGEDVDAAKELEDFYCERHKDLDSNWNEEWDCANENYQIFTHYVDDGGAAISTFKRSYLEYDFMMMTMSAKYPSPEEDDYKPVTLHEYFHIFQHSHISDECSENSRDTCERDSKMGGKDKPWFAEGGAEFMAQSLYSTQDGVRDNYLRDVMKHKLEISQDDYNSQNVSLDQLEYSSQVNAYDVGAWFIAYLVHNEGVEVFLDGFYEELDELGFDAAFEKNFNKTKNEYLSEFDTFFQQHAEDVLMIIPEHSNNSEEG